jgi:dolichol kinase
MSYRVFGQRKSIPGTLAFFVTSVAILTGFVVWGHSELGLVALIGVAAFASIVENVAIKGLDNLLLPVLVGALLIHLS